MNNLDADFDVLLAARFEREHAQIPEDPFVGATLRRIRVVQRHAAWQRRALRVATLLAVAVASPWLIDASLRLSAALESSFAWIAGLPGSLVPGAGVLVLAAIVAAGARRSR
jgi:hypothetical protein